MRRVLLEKSEKSELRADRLLFKDDAEQIMQIIISIDQYEKLLRMRDNLKPIIKCSIKKRKPFPIGKSLIVHDRVVKREARINAINEFYDELIKIDAVTTPIRDLYLNITKEK